MSSRYERYPGGTKRGHHESYEQDYKVLHDFGHGGDDDRLGSYLEVSRKIQTLIDAAADGGERLRAIGSLWSLSEVAVTNGELLGSKRLRANFPISAESVDLNYSGDPAGLRFFEAGNSIKAINEFLQPRGRSIPASGSNNGQTIAGAISTGTHGAGVAGGAVHDAVVGLHLVAGSGRSVYLERATRPVAPSIAPKLGAELIADDELFNAALVSLGSFGVIRGVLLETRPLFALQVERRRVPFDDLLRETIASGGSSGLDLGDEALGPLFHLELIFNPNEVEEGAPEFAYLVVMHEREVPDDYEAPPWKPSDRDMHGGALAFMGSLIRRMGDLGRAFVNRAAEKRFKRLSKLATIGDLFVGEPIEGPTLSTGMGIPLDKALEGLAIAFAETSGASGVLPVLISLRFVKASPALLAMNGFGPVTCVLEIDSVQTKHTLALLDRVWSRLAEAGIPFTPHWGKFNGYLSAATVRACYPAFDRWLEARRRILGEERIGDVFRSPFTDRLGVRWDPVGPPLPPIEA